MTTAAERLRKLAGFSGTAAALLLAIGSGPTAGAALVDYSGLPTGTAAEHLLAEKRDHEFSPGDGAIKPQPRQRHELAEAQPFARRAETSQRLVFPASAPAQASAPSAIQSHVPAPATTGETQSIAEEQNVAARAPEAKQVVTGNIPSIIATHFDITEFEASIADVEKAAILRKRRDDEALALILAIAETL